MDTTTTTAPTHRVVYDDGSAYDSPIACECSTCEQLTPDGLALYGGGDCRQDREWSLEWSVADGLRATLVGREGRRLAHDERVTLGKEALAARWGHIATDLIDAREEHLYWYRAWSLSEAALWVPPEYREEPTGPVIAGEEVEPAIRDAYRAKATRLATSAVRPQRHEAPDATPEEAARWIR